MTSGRIIFIFCCIALIISGKIYGAHIIGGDAVYRCVSMNAGAQTTSFAVSFTLYRDALGFGAVFDTNAEFGVYRRHVDSTHWMYVQAVTSNPTNIGFISLNDPCVEVPPNIRVEKGEYNFNVTLPWDGYVYQITYQRCCRNNTINNIVAPHSTGAVYTIELTGDAIRNCNNSPVFKQFPPIILCNNRPLAFDHSVTDAEGDSIVYSFCTPLTSGGQLGGNECTSIVPAPFKCPPPYNLVEFLPSFSADSPLAANPGMFVHPDNGLLTGTPNLTGQYVVGICIQEYRNGILLTTTRRDFQFNVLDCQNITFDKQMDLCQGDTLHIQDTVITQGGTFTIQHISSFGCDSIIVYHIDEKPSYYFEESASICPGQHYVWQGNEYSESGNYMIENQTSQGCDSIFSLKLSVLAKSESFLEYTLCDGEKVEVNGEIFEDAGQFTQKLINAAGCDSTLHIEIREGISYRDTIPVYLCISGSAVINGVTYQTAGTFIQDFQSQSGCDSLLIVRVYPCDQNVLFDFETCDALTPENSMNYSEFLPTYVTPLACGSVISSNIFREIPNENKHSCTEGQESPLSMCVSASTECDAAFATQKPVTLMFVVHPVDGSNIQWNHLVYYHRSPDQFSWVNGAQGLNNGPTKFKFTIYKNGQSVLSGQPSFTGDQWGRHQLNFNELPQLQKLKSGDTIRLEWLPFCAKGNEGTVSVWDIDNIELFFSCEDIGNRIVGGRVELSGKPDKIATIQRKEGAKIAERSTSEHIFRFENNSPFSQYIFTGDLNGSVSEGVSSLDLVRIQKHILGTQSLNNPFQYIAADINRDKKINVLDLVYLRLIILGVKETFPDNKNWVLIPEGNIDDTIHPFYWSDEYYLSEGYENVENLLFIPVKLGDVDGFPDRGLMIHETSIQKE